MIILIFIFSIGLSQRPSNKAAKGQGNKGNNKDDTNSNPSPPPVDNNVNAFVNVDYGCHRHRRPWHELDQDERNQYINGFLELSRIGKLSTFTRQHASSVSSPQAHNTAAFLPWHRYFLWEMETAIRSLGDEYECFALPYWYIIIIHLLSDFV